MFDDGTYIDVEEGRNVQIADQEAGDESRTCSTLSKSLLDSKNIESSDDVDPVLTAFNPEDYEYTMFLSFVDPLVEKEYLQNAKIKVI